MESWEDAYSHLRASFVHEAAARLEQITQLLDALAANPARTASFLELRRASTPSRAPDLVRLPGRDRLRAARGA